MSETIFMHWNAERGAYTVKETETHFIDVIPMIFNDRVVLTPKSCPFVYDWGWCFDKGGAAFVAALIWDPDTEPEPVGYKKCATGHRTTADLP